MIITEVLLQLLSHVGISTGIFHLCQTQLSFVAMYCLRERGATCGCNSTLNEKATLWVLIPRALCGVLEHLTFRLFQ